MTSDSKEAPNNKKAVPEKGSEAEVVIPGGLSAEAASNQKNTASTLWAEAFAFTKTLAFLLAAAFLLKASVIEAFKIPSESMLPTLKVGDQLLVSKFSYGLRIPFKREVLFQYDSPQRGDIVVFTHPDDPSTSEDESDTNIIKRVIGLPGDKIEVRGTKVFINEQYYPESYARWVLGGIKEGNFGPVTVPEGHVLLLGDNRDKSRDSRFWDNPFLDMKRIKGRALIIYWSFDDIGRIGTIIR
jgi:signal peptidase I